jgi:putative membrane protein
MTPIPPAVAKPLDSSTSLAVERTRLAYERTLMAWVRTATALISFGFTIYKFFEFEISKGNHESSRTLSPRHFAMVMIVIGLLALLFSAIDHRRSLKMLQVEYGVERRSVSLVVAAVVSVMGLLALGAAIFRA